MKKRAFGWALVLAFCAILVCGAVPALAEGPLTLSEALRLAEAGNPTLLSAREDLNAAKAKEFQAYWQFGWSGNCSVSVDDPTEPEGSVGFGYGQLIGVQYMNNLNPLGTDRIETWAVSLSPFTMSEIVAIRQAIVQRQASEVQYRSTLEALRFDASSAFMGVLESDALVELANRSLEATTRRFNDGKAKEQAGLLAKADLIRLEAAVYQQRATLAQARGNAVLARARLAGLIGMDFTQIGALETSLPTPAAEITQEDVINKALASRGEIGVANARITLAQLAKTATMLGPLRGVSLDYRSVGGNGSYGVSAQFSLGGDLANLKYSEAGEKSARLAAEAQRQAVIMQARQAYLEFATAKERLEYTRLALEAAREVARVMMLRFDAGLATVAESLDAAVAAEQAEQQYLQSQHDLFLAQLKINQVTWNSSK